MNEKFVEFARTVARSACLNQRVGKKCVCFSCEAKRLLAAPVPVKNYFETLSETVVEIHSRLDADAVVLATEWSQQIYDRGHVAYGATERHDYEIVTLNGRPTKKWFHVVIYRMDRSGAYELVTYTL